MLRCRCQLHGLRAAVVRRSEHHRGVTNAGEPRHHWHRVGRGAGSRGIHRGAVTTPLPAVPAHPLHRRGYGRPGH